MTPSTGMGGSRLTSVSTVARSSLSGLSMEALAPTSQYGRSALVAAGDFAAWGSALRFDQVKRPSAGAVSAKHGDGRESGVRHNVGKCASRVLARVCKPIE